MRFSNLVGSFPKPVFRPFGFESSYEEATFMFSLTCENESNPHKLRVDFFIDNADILDLIKSGSAAVALTVHCERTYYYELVELALRRTQVITLNERLFFGNVYFSIIVKANRAIPKFAPSNLKPAFKGMSFDIEKGDVLALSEEHLEVYSLPPLPLGDGIFELVLQPELPPDEFSVELAEHKIQVGVGERLNRLIQANMNTTIGRTQNISCIYFPVLVDVLHQVQIESFDGKAWYEAVNMSMSNIGLDIKSDSWEPLGVAQQLLRAPFIKLFQSLEP